MPKLREPNSLEDLAIESLGRHVFNVSQKAIDDIVSGRTPQLNINLLNRFLHEDIPHVLSQKITDHIMFSVVTRLLESLERQEYVCRRVKNIIESVISASICPHLTNLHMPILPKYAQRTLLTDNICKFKKLRTLNIARFLEYDVIELLSISLGCLKLLVNFRMRDDCTDAIVNTLGMFCSKTLEQIDVTNSSNVTNASIQVFMKCHKLKHLLISNTSVTAKGYVRLLQSIQHKMSNTTAKGFLHISVGRLNEWKISSEQLNEIAITCPMLRQLEIHNLRGDMGKLDNLTELEILKIYYFIYDECNLDGFLRMRGSHLKSLKLYSVPHPINLVSIMNHCINLKELKLYNCSIMNIIMGRGPTEKAAKTLQNLEILEINCRNSLHSIEHILCLCINIKRLELFTENEEDEPTDEFIIRLLSRNPMKKLTKFSTCSMFLSMKSVNAIIEKCPLLETLEHLDMWKGVTDREIKILRQNIEDKNQDLRINLTEEEIW